MLYTIHVEIGGEKVKPVTFWGADKKGILNSMYPFSGGENGLSAVDCFPSRRVIPYTICHVNLFSALAIGARKVGHCII